MSGRKFFEVNVDEARSELGAALVVALPTDESVLLRHLVLAFLHLGGTVSATTREKLADLLEELDV